MLVPAEMPAATFGLFDADGAFRHLCASVANAWSPSAVTDDGTETPVSSGHPAKAPSPIAVTEVGIVTDLIDVQREKA